MMQAYHALAKAITVEDPDLLQKTLSHGLMLSPAELRRMTHLAAAFRVLSEGHPVEVPRGLNLPPPGPTLEEQYRLLLRAAAMDDFAAVDALLQKYELPVTPADVSTVKTLAEYSLHMAQQVQCEQCISILTMYGLVVVKEDKVVPPRKRARANQK